VDHASLLALAGVVVGALVSYVTTALTEQVRWRRESRARWENRLVDAIVAFAAALKMQSRVCLRIAGSFWPTMTTSPMDPATGGDLLGRYEDERSTEFERLLLLAPEPIVSAARAWQESVWVLHAVQDGMKGVDQESLESKFADAATCREAFYRATRTSLGIAGALPATPTRASRLDPTWQSNR
jgi:hypothetical protein